MGECFLKGIASEYLAKLYAPAHCNTSSWHTLRSAGSNQLVLPPVKLSDALSV